MQRYLYLSIICFLANFNTILGQESDGNICDSLSQKIDYIYQNNLLDEAKTLPLSKQIYQSYKKNDCPNIAKALNLLAFELYNENEIIQATKLLFEAEASIVDKSLESKKLLAVNQLYLGLIYTIEKDFESAAFYFETSKNLSIQLKNDSMIADAGLNLGLAHLELGNLEKAKFHLTAAYQASKKVNVGLLTGYSLQNLSRLFLLENNREKSLEYAYLAKKKWEEIDHPKGLYYVNLFIAQIYQKENKIDKRIEHLKKSLEMSDKAEVKIGLFDVYTGLAESYQALGDIDQTKANYEKAIENFVNPELQGIEYINNKLIDLYQADGETEKIKELYKKLAKTYQLKEGLKKIETENKINKSISLSKKINENEILKDNKAENEVKIQKRNLLLIFFILTSLGILAMFYASRKENRLRKELNNKIKDHNTELTKINSELEESKSLIDNKNQELEQKNSELKNFAYVASHDLKAPARTIMSFAEILSQKIAPLLDTEDLQILNFIKSGSKNMHELITDLLDYSLAENKESKFAHYKTEELIEQVLFNLQEQINQTNAKIEIGKLHKSMVVDRQKIQQLFQNIISNGIKFSSKNNIPVIKIEASETEKFYQFRITDNGIGISKENQKNVFNMFSRASSTKDYEGSGIGLATCQKVINLHKGDIYVKSEEGKGSTFVFKISKELRPSLNQHASILQDSIEQ